MQRLAAELWGDGKHTAERKVGRGRVVTVKRAAQPPAESERPSLPAEARWIWYPEGAPSASAAVGTRLFHRVFDLDEGTAVESAWLVMTADNAFEVQVNDKPVGEGDNFKQTYAFDLKPLLKPGTNRLSVLAERWRNA